MPNRPRRRFFRSFLGLSAILILRIVYGKDRRAIIDTPDCLVILLGALNGFWAMSTFFLFFEENVVLPLIIAVGYPVVIAIWAMIARKRYRKVAKIHAAMDSMETNASGDKKKQLAEESNPNQPGVPTRKKGKYLVCPDCGRRQLSSRTDCWDCRRVFEEQDYEYIEQKLVCQEPEVPEKAKKKYLVCPDCGRTQLSSRTDCWNCKRVFEEQDYEYE